MARTAKKETALTAEEKLAQALVPEAEQPYKVPENWCWVPVGRINQYDSEILDPSKHPEEIFELYSVPSSAEDYPEIVSGQEIGSSKQGVEKGDVLLCKINPRINRVWIVSQHTDNTLLASSEWIVIRNYSVNPDYLMYCFRSPYFRDYMLSNVSGVGGSLMRAQPKYVQNYPVPIPPFTEQQRIVDRIESLFAKLDEAKEKAQAVVDGFEDRKAAILHKAFTGELTAEWRKDVSKSFSEWMPKSIGEISDVKGGKRVPKGMTLTDVDTGHPYIKAGNLKQGTVIDNDISFVPDDVLPFIKNYTVSAGDVYITNVGACIGDCGVIPPKYDGANLTENAVKLTNLHCVSEYLAWYLSSNNVQRLIKSLVASATLGKLSIANIKTIPVLLPSEEEQLKIIEVINQLLEQEQHAKEAAEQVIDQIDTMKKAILARAFRGELGTNDPTDESAEELLKRVLSGGDPHNA